MLAKTEKKQFETSSVESSPTTILGSNPKQIVYAFSIYTAQIIYLSFEFEFECEKNENKQKEAGIGPYLKKQFETKYTSFQLIVIVVNGSNKLTHAKMFRKSCNEIRSKSSSLTDFLFFLLLLRCGSCSNRGWGFRNGRVNVRADPITIFFSINLLYTHFRPLPLVEILEQPIRMLKTSIV